MVYEIVSCPKRENPWERHPEDDEELYTPDVMHYIKNLSSNWPIFAKHKENRFLDIHTKRIALVASPFVVSLVSYTGEKEMNKGSGFIIGSEDANTGIVFTSANLIRKPTEKDIAENELADDLKVQVKLADGRSFEGVICAHDFHYNIAAMRFTSDSVVFCAPVKRLDDSLDLNPRQHDGKSFQIRSHSSSPKLAPGDAIVGVGRYFAHPSEVMAAPGFFSLDCCGYDCKELFKATCRITRKSNTNTKDEK